MTGKEQKDIYPRVRYSGVWLNLDKTLFFNHFSNSKSLILHIALTNVMWILPNEISNKHNGDMGKQWYEFSSTFSKWEKS